MFIEVTREVAYEPEPFKMMVNVNSIENFSPFAKKCLIEVGSTIKQFVVEETYDQIKQKIAEALNPVEITCNNDYKFPMNTQEM